MTQNYYNKKLNWKKKNWTHWSQIGHSSFLFGWGYQNKKASHYKKHFLHTKIRAPNRPWWRKNRPLSSPKLPFFFNQVIYYNPSHKEVNPIQPELAESFLYKQTLAYTSDYNPSSPVSRLILFCPLLSFTFSLLSVLNPSSSLYSPSDFLWVLLPFLIELFRFRYCFRL